MSGSTVVCPHFVFTLDISLFRARPVCLNLWALLLSSDCQDAWEVLSIYRYTFLCVHVIGMAVTEENSTSWRAVLACCFLLVDPWNIVDFKIKFWYSKLRVYKIHIKSAYLNLYSTLYKLLFYFVFSYSNSWKFHCDDFVIAADEILLVDAVHIVHLKCFLII